MSNNGIFNSFSTTNTGTFGTRAFLESNSLVAKFAFLLLVIFGFIILLRIGITVLSWFFKPSESPHLIDGMVDAKQMIIYPQDPSSNGAVTIYRSINATQGVEFTWSVWIFISSMQTNSGIYKHIFSKGNSNLTNNGLISPNNAPGLYIAPNTNALVVKMNTFNVINEEVVIPNIPINKWVNVIIRCQNTKLDVYVNGTVVRSVNLVGVPKQNYGDVYVALGGGFNGYLSNLWYWSKALSITDIQNLYTKGPNTKSFSTDLSSYKRKSSANYLSLQWYLNG